MGSRSKREMMAIIIPALVLILAAFALAYQFVEPAPPRLISMTTGSREGAYYAFGEKYAAALAKSGVTLEVRPSAGTLENLARLTNPAAHTQVALIQGGLANASTHPGLTSLGRMYLEPLWLFHRTGVPLERLSDLADLRIAVGVPGSGTRPLVTSILKLAGITDQTATFLDTPSNEAVAQLMTGDIDAVFLTMAAENPVVQKMLAAREVRVFSFSQADALVRLNPYLTKIVLPAGVIDMAQDIPPTDIALVAPAATLVVQKDLHPALIGLLVEAAKTIHSPAGLFKNLNEFPQAIDTELPIDPDAVRTYKNGPSFLHRYLPFWLAVFFERMAVMIIPIATVAFPIVRLAPVLYRWRIKQRILYWYGQLKTLERRMRIDRKQALSHDHIEDYFTEVHRIEDAVSAIPMPLAFSDQLYSLRTAVDLVRQRIGALVANDGVDTTRVEAHPVVLRAQAVRA